MRINNAGFVVNIWWNEGNTKIVMFSELLLFYTCGFLKCRKPTSGLTRASGSDNDWSLV